jgi:hypothetical protein
MAGDLGVKTHPVHSFCGGNDEKQPVNYRHPAVNANPFFFSQSASTIDASILNPNERGMVLGMKVSTAELNLRLQLTSSLSSFPLAMHFTLKYSFVALAVALVSLEVSLPHPL